MLLKPGKMNDLELPDSLLVPIVSLIGLLCLFGVEHCFGWLVGFAFGIPLLNKPTQFISPRMQQVQL